MSAPLSVELTLYGAFRAHVGGAPLRLTLPAGATLADARRELGAALRARAPGFVDDALIAVSAFADERRLLRDDTPLADGAAIAVLPPICGG